jgi:hypothetical protein
MLQFGGAIFFCNHAVWVVSYRWIVRCFPSHAASQAGKFQIPCRCVHSMRGSLLKSDPRMSDKLSDWCRMGFIYVTEHLGKQPRYRQDFIAFSLSA